MNEISYEPARTGAATDAASELSQMLAAQETASPASREALAQSFLARVQRDIDEQVDFRVKQQLATSRPTQTTASSQTPQSAQLAMALGSMGIAIPLTAIAGGIAGLPGIIIVWLGLILINVAWTQRR